MEKVINSLFEIEKKANQILDRANTEKTELLEENEKAIARMEAEISDENNKKIELLNEQAEREIDNERQSLIAKFNKQLNDLEYNYTQNHDSLVNKVFQAIIQL